MKEKGYYYTAGNLRRELNEVNKITEQRTEEEANILHEASGVDQ